MTAKLEQLNLVNRLLQADVVCKDCGTKYGKYSVGCSSTWNGTCGVCGEDKPVTEVRDWGYLTKGIHAEKAKIKEQSLEVANYIACQEELTAKREDLIAQMVSVGPVIMSDDELADCIRASYGQADNHSITPTQEMVDKWVAMLEYCEDIDVFSDIAQWGADQELEACCEWLEQNCGRWDLPAALRDGRRPKPPSLKEQALSELAGAVAAGNITPERGALIRLALEELPD